MASSDPMPRHSPDLVSQYRAKGLWNDDTIATFLERRVARAPASTAIVHGTRSVSFEETHRQARRFANALLELGLRRGDVIGIQLPNLPEFVIAYCGASLMGGVVCLLHMPYRAREMEPLMQHGSVKAMICSAPLPNYNVPETMAALRQRVGSLQHVIVANGPAEKSQIAMADMITSGSDRAIADPPVAADPCVLAFTSGTAAAPKAVLRTHETMAANARIYSPTIALTERDRVMVAPPFTHVFGLCCATLALHTGAANVLMPLFTPQAYADTLIQGQPTVLFSAPAHVAASMKSGLLEGADLSSVRDVIVAGAVCPPEVAAAFERILPNGRVGQLFGMTETILIMQTPLDAPAAVRHTSTGRITNGIQMRIVNPETGEPVPTGEEAELHVRGYSIMAGYYKNEQANAAAFTADGWFRTGDLARVDRDGNVVITGRLKDFINRGGIKINPTDTENLIQAHPNVVLAAIVPYPCPVLGERACLFVTLKPGTTLTLEDINEYLASHGVAKMIRPEKLRVVQEMPMTPTRKIIKGELKRLASVQD